jgi:uncharacterized RDD family membrane protein YckC
MENYQSEPKASPQHRLGGIALDVALILSTCYIGWIIWSLVIWGQGLTPAKQILKMRVVSSITGKTASWGHMAIRQFLIPIAMTLPFSILQLAFEPYLFDANYWADPSYYDYSLFASLGSFFIGLLSLGVSLLDAFWIFKGGQNRRVTDLWAKTDVLNTSATPRN